MLSLPAGFTSIRVAVAARAWPSSFIAKSRIRFIHCQFCAPIMVTSLRPQSYQGQHHGVSTSVVADQEDRLTPTVSEYRLTTVINDRRRYGRYRSILQLRRLRGHYGWCLRRLLKCNRVGDTQSRLTNSFASPFFVAEWVYILICRFA
jgi:hypothetical protein